VEVDPYPVSGMSRVFCVLGHPVGHSVSPAMQNAALRRMGIDGIYVAFDVPPEGLPEAVKGLRALGIGGVNCTIPHKEAVIPLVDELSPDAELIGAVNTLVFQGRRITGHNTDAPGFLSAVRAAGVEPAGKRIVVLGAGGAARAVLVALARCGAEIVLANRTLSRGQELAAELNEKLGGAIRVLPLQASLLRDATREADLLVNTTAAGMSPQSDTMPDVPEDAFHAGLFVYDLVYNPHETRLLRTARSRGARGTHGAGMLAHQGAVALELWTGVPAPAGLMEEVVLERLSGGS